jgi:hypothetical protein
VSDAAGDALDLRASGARRANVVQGATLGCAKGSEQAAGRRARIHRDDPLPEFVRLELFRRARLPIAPHIQLRAVRGVSLCDGGGLEPLEPALERIDSIGLTAPGPVPESRELCVEGLLFVPLARSGALVGRARRAAIANGLESGNVPLMRLTLRR